MQEPAPLATMASMSKLGQKERAQSGAVMYGNGSMDDDSGGQIGGIQQSQVCPCLTAVFCGMMQVAWGDDPVILS